MKKTFMILSYLLCASLLSFGQSTDEGLRVQEIAKKKFQWLISHQVDSLDAVLDDRLKYIHSNGMIQSKRDIIDELKNGKVTYKNIDIREMDVRVYDAVAIVTGKGKFSGVNAEKPFEVDLLFTEVYVWKNKTWRLASRHASKLP